MPRIIFQRYNRTSSRKHGYRGLHHGTSKHNPSCVAKPLLIFVLMVPSSGSGPIPQRCGEFIAGAAWMGGRVGGLYVVVLEHDVAREVNTGTSGNLRSLEEVGWLPLTTKVVLCGFCALCGRNGQDKRQARLPSIQRAKLTCCRSEFKRFSRQRISPRCCTQTTSTPHTIISNERVPKTKIKT